METTKKAYWKLLLSKVFLLISEKDKPYFKNHLKRYEKTLEKIGDPADKLILDVGAYPGHISLAISLCKSVGGVYVISDGDETVESNLRFLKSKGIRCMKLDIEHHKLPFPDNYFDLVIFTEVIEHLTVHPKFCLDEIKRVLKKNGRIILSTPNVADFSNIYSLIRGRNITEIENYYRTKPYAGHRREYTIKEIKELLKQTGFRIIGSEFCEYSKLESIKATLKEKTSLKIKLSLLFTCILIRCFPSLRQCIFCIAEKKQMRK